MMMNMMMIASNSKDTRPTNLILVAHTGAKLEPPQLALSMMMMMMIAMMAMVTIMEMVAMVAMVAIVAIPI